MGSVAKAVKKVTKVVKKPISKITKGIAKGIVKVGKATMRGVAKIQNKLGPLGSIAMAIAMPYALNGLSTMVGSVGQGALHGGMNSGLLGSNNVFLRSIGQVGNAIRTGYQATTGFVKAGMKKITSSITEGFSSMGKGNNLWSRVSNGAKNLFNKSKAAVQKMKPLTSKGGSVDVQGFGYSPHSDFVTSSMSNTQAAQLLESGAITGDQLVGQSFGKTGWLTKANPMDKAVADAINSTYETNIMTGFDSTAKKAFLDYKTAADASGVPYNYQNIDTMMRDNLINNSTADGASFGFDFSKSGDYNMRAGGGGQGTYEFNGNKTFKANNGKSSYVKKKVTQGGTANKVMSYVNKALLAPDKIDIPDIQMDLMSDMTQQTDGNTVYGGTNITGSSGGSLLDNVYTDAQKEQIMNYYKHMNIIGSS